MIQLADKLKKLRHKKGISQELLAKELGISRQAISKWESDTAQPDLDNLAKLCEIFNISADDLLEIHIEKQASVSDENGDCSKEVTAYKRNAAICISFTFADLLLVYLITIFKPELKVGSNSQIIHLWELKFWFSNGLAPLFLAALTGVVLSIFFYYKYLISK